VVSTGRCWVRRFRRSSQIGRGPRNTCPDHSSRKGRCPLLRCEFDFAGGRWAWIGSEASWLSPQIDWPGRRSLCSEWSRARRLRDPVPATGPRQANGLRWLPAAAGSMMSDAVDTARHAGCGKARDARNRPGGATCDASGDGAGALDPIPDAARWPHALTIPTVACVAHDGGCLNRKFHRWDSFWVDCTWSSETVATAGPPVGCEAGDAAGNVAGQEQ